MRVRVIRVAAIPCGLSVLVDEQAGSLVVWLLESEWPQPLAQSVEQILTTLWSTREGPATMPQPDLHTV